MAAPWSMSTIEDVVDNCGAPMRELTHMHCIYILPSVIPLSDSF